MNVHIKSSEYAWHHTEVKMVGKIITGITAWEFKRSQEVEELRGAGQYPIDLQKGNISFSGSLTLFGFEMDRLEQAAQAAGYDSILDVPHELISIVVTARKLAKDPITTIVATGVAFKETTDAMQQGASKRDCPLPFTCMNLDKKTISI